VTELGAPSPPAARIVGGGPPGSPITGPRFDRLVRSELLKLRTTRLWWGLLIGVAAGTTVFAVAQAALAGVNVAGSELGGGGATLPGLNDPATIRGIYTAGLGVVYLITLALGVISMAGEYRNQTITATVLASPRRDRVVLGKLVAVALAGLGYGVATVLVGVVTGGIVVLIRGADLQFADPTIWRALAGAVLAVALWAVLGLGLGTLIRNQVLALLLAVGFAWLAEPIIGFGLNAANQGTIARFLPTQATSAIVSPALPSGTTTVLLLPWWGGALCLLGYAAVSGALGLYLTLRRDIT
jgi:ABC-type transport system involved in multi-copper enzyme maturation permease subunit